MNLKTRRIIMYSFILAFLILAPIVIFYSSGYRFDLKRHQVLKTGTLFLEAKEINKANLYVNNKLIEDPFSNKKYIYNLLPGEYLVKLSKSGYHDWQKKAIIYSGLTTFIKDAILFKKDVPLQIADGNISELYLSPDSSKIAYLEKNDTFSEIYLLDLSSNNTDLIYRFTSKDQTTSLSWAASSKKIMLSYDSTHIIIDTNNPKNIFSLNAVTNFKAQNIIWDINSDNILFTEYQDSIYRIDLYNKKSEKIFSSPDTQINPTFFIEGNDIFYISEQIGQNSLNKYNLQFKTEKQIIELSKNSNYKFIKSTNNYLGLIDLDQQNLLLIKKIDADYVTSLQNQTKNFNAKEAFWDDKQNQLLIYDDFEIKIYNTDANKELFINRYGNPIKKISWYPDLSHLLILFDNNIEIIDITQEVGTRNYIEIAKFDQISNFAVTPDGKAVYFSGQIGKQQGLYRLNLQ
ncbi:MAG: hypothetical protein NTZ49_04435 [Candidatus Parcubacteria bacterium]|nr:hypothetical protein [Candidatus Parcubacteria bacterium]